MMLIVVIKDGINKDLMSKMTDLSSNIDKRVILDITCIKGFNATIQLKTVTPVLLLILLSFGGHPMWKDRDIFMIPTNNMTV